MHSKRFLLFGGQAQAVFDFGLHGVQMLQILNLAIWCIQ